MKVDTQQVPVEPVLEVTIRLSKEETAALIEILKRDAEESDHFIQIDNEKTRFNFSLRTRLSRALIVRQ